MARHTTNRFPIVARYVTCALLIGLPGVFFSAKALSMVLYQQRKLEVGIVHLDVPGIQGMPINTYIRWMLVFSVPLFVFSMFILYRLNVRLIRGDIRAAKPHERLHGTVSPDTQNDLDSSARQA